MNILADYGGNPRIKHNMKFRELIKKYHWNDVRPVLLRLYPDEEKNILGYKRIYAELLNMKPARTKMRIVIESRFDEFDKEYYTDVHGRNGILNKENDPEHFSDDESGNRETTYAIEFTPWEEWLGMKIEPINLDRYNDIEIISHCLYEMTFAGFDQATIKKEIDEVEGRVKEYENMTEKGRRKRLVPVENIIGKFKKKNKTK